MKLKRIKSVFFRFLTIADSPPSSLHSMQSKQGSKWKRVEVYCALSHADLREEQPRLTPVFCRKGLNRSWNAETWISRMCGEGGGLGHASRFTTSRDRCSPQIYGAKAFHCKELPRVIPEAKVTKHIESRCKWKLIYFNCYLSRNVQTFAVSVKKNVFCSLFPPPFCSQ